MDHLVNNNKKYYYSARTTMTVLIVLLLLLLFPNKNECIFVTASPGVVSTSAINCKRRAFMTSTSSSSSSSSCFLPPPIRRSRTIIPRTRRRKEELQVVRRPTTTTTTTTRRRLYHQEQRHHLLSTALPFGTRRTRTTSTTSTTSLFSSSDDDTTDTDDDTTIHTIGVGIDLGTTYSAVAAYLPPNEFDGDNKQQQYPQIIPIPNDGKNTMPSVVRILLDNNDDDNENNVIVGAVDDNDTTTNTTPNEITYRNVKRIIGTGGNVPQDTVDVVPHVLVNPNNGKTFSKLKKSKSNKSKSKKKKKDKDEGSSLLMDQIYDSQHYPTMLLLNNATNTISPETISSHIIRKLKRTAEHYVGKSMNENNNNDNTKNIVIKVDRAVIGVPAYFHDGQREATIRAAQMAGIPRVKLLREPEAAALAYGICSTRNKNHDGYTDNDTGDELVLVFDLGGGTYDVSMLLVGGGLTEIISTSGNVQLGGTDFDRRIAQYCINQIKKIGGGVNSNKLWENNDPDVKSALLLASEQIRIHLSNNRYANIALPLNPNNVWKKSDDDDDDDDDVSSSSISSDSVILPNDYKDEDEGRILLTEEGHSNSTHVLFRLSRRTFERLCRDEFRALLRPIREVCIMSGALLPGDTSPALVDAALDLHDNDNADLDFEDFYSDDDDDDDDDEEEDSGDADRMLLELQKQEEQEMLEMSMREAKRSQQRGRKRARNVAKSEKKFRAEKRKLLEDTRPRSGGGGADNSRSGGGGSATTAGGGGGGGGTKVRDGITGRPISRVVLVGGATRMPAIGRLLGALTGTIPQRTVNPDEAVALGCAVHVGVLDGEENMGTVLNPMQAAILRAVAEKEGLLNNNPNDNFDDDDFDFDDEDFDNIEYY